jgi:hypothetical protein
MNYSTLTLFILFFFIFYELLTMTLDPIKLLSYDISPFRQSKKLKLMINGHVTCMCHFKKISFTFVLTSDQ